MLIYLDEYRKAKVVRAVAQDYQWQQRDCVNGPARVTPALLPAEGSISVDPDDLDRIYALASRF